MQTRRKTLNPKNNIKRTFEVETIRISCPFGSDDNVVRFFYYLQTRNGTSKSHNEQAKIGDKNNLHDVSSTATALESNPITCSPIRRPHTGIYV